MADANPLHCPTCGAPLAAPSAMQFTCSYCHTVLAITAQPQLAASADAVVRLHGFGHGKIMAIKAVRELTGLGLADAKNLVEGPMPADLRATRQGAQLAVALADLQSAGAQYEVLEGTPAQAQRPTQQSPPARPTETCGPGDAAALHVMLARSGPNKIAVIKVIREVTGLGLKESKDLCDGAPCRFAALPRYDEAKLLRLFADAGASARVER